MTLNGVMAVIVPHSVAFGADYVKVTEEGYFLDGNVAQRIYVFSNVSLMAIFAQVTENEGIIERHLSNSCEIAVI